MRRLLPPISFVLCAVGAAAVLAAPALAADPAVVDCTSHNRLTRPYSASQLRHALATMSADVKEYTGCADILQRALDDQLARRRGGSAVSSSATSTGGGSFLPTPVIVVLVVVLLGGAIGGAVTLRRRSGP